MFTSPSLTRHRFLVLNSRTSDYGEDSKVATCTSFEKEFNVMTQDDLDRLRETYSFPTGIQANIPNEGETILSTRSGVEEEILFHLSGCLGVLPESSSRQMSPTGSKNMGHPRSISPSIAKGCCLAAGTTLRASSRMVQLLRATRVSLDIPEMNNSEVTTPKTSYSNSSSSSSSGVISESRLPSELISDGMSKRISLKKLAQKVEEAKGMSSATKSTPATKGVVINEKCPRKKASNVFLSEAKLKGKEALPPPAAKKAKSATSRSASVAKKILSGVILPVDNEKVDKLSLDQVVTKFFHNIGQIWAIELKGLLAKFSEREKKAVDELKARSNAVARLEEEVPELEKNEVLAKKKAVEEYNKGQLAHHHPNLGIDLDGMGLDHDLLEEEEEKEEERDKEKEGNKKKGEEKDDASPFSP
ncbi:hypothetical protein Acr_00g0059850 [Actinidia rufa]|uniref:Uncharacterized protein n=1 Tax=Actinidia rufa TaxID=165716 RepID=A0A7J0DQ59_9ERIC|nr:hypothetical protein Acr_00g0059850 [Actinidia rufa]